MSKYKPVVVFIGTYPPRECGIATFTQDLLRASRHVLGANISCKVAALSLSPLDHYLYPPEVTWEINQNNKKEYIDLANKLNADPQISGIILQHEYGIYGGIQGENILSFVENCKKPILVTLHTVLPKPTLKMHNVTSRIIHHANVIVVLTQSSRHVLETVYPFSVGKVYVIPHGVHFVPFVPPSPAKKKLKLANSTIISTFGLLSRGKGIEYVLQSLPPIIKKYPSLLYLIIGETHPAVRRTEGESYRKELAKLVTRLGLKKHVKFYDRYLDLTDLLEFLKATDIYISTSINPNQSVSGTLSYALGTGRAVISTEFAQAKEIITPQIGRLVPIKDSSSFTTALLDLLSDDLHLKQMHLAAYDLTRPMLWDRVAQDYSHLFAQSVLPPINLKHLKKMTDDLGLLQFTRFNDPSPDFGYTIDDNARALIVCSQLLQQTHPQKGLDRLIHTYFNFISTCQQPDGNFINYIGSDKTPTFQNTTEDLSEALSRTMWALTEVMNNPKLSPRFRAKARVSFLRALPHVKSLPHLRAQAFIIKALTKFHNPELLGLITQISSSLAQALKSNSDGSWQWFEDHLAYNNALLSEALLLSGSFLKDRELIRLGTLSLQFLINETFCTNMYIPIGNATWYKRHQQRSHFDQQPEDPASMIMALTTAFQVTGDESYRNLARKCFSWFLGNNSLHQPLYDYLTGGCYDGLQPDHVNLNQGAESLVSYLLSRIAINNLAAHENQKLT